MRVTPDVVDFPLPLSSSGQPPSEFKIFPAGKWTAHKEGEQLVRFSTPENMRAIAALAMKRKRGGIQLGADYYHNSLSESASPEAGIYACWFDLEARGAELWATNVKWNDRARDMIVADEIRHFSPAFNYDEDGKVVGLINVALTNIPAMDENAPLAAASQRARIRGFLQRLSTGGSGGASSALHPEGSHMKTKLSEFLGEHEMSMDEISKKSGVEKDRLKAIMGGEKCSDDELAKFAKCFGKSHDEMKAMHASEHEEKEDDDSEEDAGDDDSEKPEDEREHEGKEGGREEDDGDGDSDDEEDDPEDGKGDGEGGPAKAPKEDEYQLTAKQSKRFSFELLSITKAPKLSVALGMIRGWKEKATMFDKLQARVEKLEKKNFKTEFDSLIARGRAEGKVNDELEAWCRKTLKDADELRGYLSAAPKRFAKTSTTHATTEEERAGGAEALSGAAKKISEQFGISTEDLAKHAPKALDKMSKVVAGQISSSMTSDGHGERAE